MGQGGRKAGRRLPEFVTEVDVVDQDGGRGRGWTSFSDGFFTCEEVLKGKGGGRQERKRRPFRKERKKSFRSL